MLIYNRRLPIYILLDCSESMVGDPIAAVNKGLQQLVFDLKQDPQAIETAWISLIAFSREARQICPLTEVLSFVAPTLTVGPGTCLGSALDLLGHCIERDVHVNSPTKKGDWKPLVFLLTDGLPTDEWRPALNRLKARTAHRMADLVALGCGEDADAALLREITPNVLLTREASTDQMKKFFKMVSSSVAIASASPSGDAGSPMSRMESVFSMPGKFIAPEPGRVLSQLILAARCQKDGQGYLMRYRLANKETAEYKPENSYRVARDYFSTGGDAGDGHEIDASKLLGAPACPYCGRVGWKMAPGGKWLVCNNGIKVTRGFAQVVFVLDITGSMHGEIEGVKDSIKDFMSYIEKEGLSVEVGLIAFRDLQERELPQILKFGGSMFTKDSAAFKAQVSSLKANGGGRTLGESSYDALAMACRHPFSADASRILILITDEPPHLPDGKVQTMKDLEDAFAMGHIDQLHLLISPYLDEVYAPLHRYVGGGSFALAEGGRGGVAFGEVLMDVGKQIGIAARQG